LYIDTPIGINQEFVEYTKTKVQSIVPKEKIESTPQKVEKTKKETNTPTPQHSKKQSPKSVDIADFWAQIDKTPMTQVEGTENSFTIRDTTPDKKPSSQPTPTKRSSSQTPPPSPLTATTPLRSSAGSAHSTRPRAMQRSSSSPVSSSKNGGENLYYAGPIAPASEPKEQEMLTPPSVDEFFEKDNSLLG